MWGKKEGPPEDRLYLRDPRAKTGSKGTLQLGPVDKQAVKKAKRKLERELCDQPVSDSLSWMKMSSSEQEVSAADSGFTHKPRSSV